jgi:hypothetical protein
MPEPLLDDLDRDAALEQIGRVCVAEVVQGACKRQPERRAERTEVPLPDIGLMPPA